MPNGVKKCGQESTVLITKALTKFSNLFGKDGYLENHQHSECHKHAVELCKEFLRCYSNPEFQIQNLLSSERLRQVQENRKRLMHILDPLITMAQQNIAF